MRTSTGRYRYVHGWELIALGVNHREYGVLPDAEHFGDFADREGWANHRTGLRLATRFLSVIALRKQSTL